MVEKSNTPADFMARMLDVQQQYLNNLGQMFQPGQSSDGESPFNAWFSQFPSSGQDGFDDFFRNLAEASLSVMRNPAGDLNSLLQSGQLPPDWYETMQGQFNQWLESASKNSLFEQMNERLRQQLSTPFSIDGMGQGFNPATMLDSSVLKTLQGLYNLEEKQAGEQLLKTLAAYQQQAMRMNHMMAQVGIDSIRTLETQLENGADSDISRIYQSWKTISEKVFAEMKLDKHYRELKAAMRKIEEQLKIDLDHYRQALIEHLGLVARQDYDSLKQELAELRAEVAQLASAAVTASTRATEPAPREPSGKAGGNDDFTVLKGIGDKFNQKLHEQGIHSLSELAAMSDDMLKALDQSLNTNGRLFQQQWREQAENLVKNMTKGK